MMQVDFKTLLSFDNFDWDYAMHLLAISLGLAEDTSDSYFRNKGFYWSNSPLSQDLGKILDILVESKYILYDKDKQKYTWNTEND